MDNDIVDTLNALYTKIATEQNARIEADLTSILGDLRGMTKAEIGSLGYEIVYQQLPGIFVDEYRGIRRRGKWVIDHFPHWA